MRRLKVNETDWIIMVGIALYLLWMTVYFFGKI